MHIQTYTHIHEIKQSKNWCIWESCWPRLSFWWLILIANLTRFGITRTSISEVVFEGVFRVCAWTRAWSMHMPSLVVFYLIFWERRSLNMELTYLARLAGQWAQRASLSLGPVQDDRCILLHLIFILAGHLNSGSQFCMESTSSTESAFLPSSETFNWAPIAHPWCQLYNLIASDYGLNKKEKRERPGISHMRFLVDMHQAVPASILFLLWWTIFSELWAKINATS